MADIERMKALTKAVENCPMDIYKNPIMAKCDPTIVKKFIQHHNLVVSLSQVVSYTDFGVFGYGKKGRIVTEHFLYVSGNGKKGKALPFKNLAGATQHYNTIIVHRTNGWDEEYTPGTDAADTTRLLNAIAKALAESPQQPVTPQAAPAPKAPVDNTANDIVKELKAEAEAKYQADKKSYEASAGSLYTFKPTEEVVETPSADGEITKLMATLDAAFAKKFAEMDAMPQTPPAPVEAPPEAPRRMEPAPEPEVPDMQAAEVVPIPEAVPEPEVVPEPEAVPEPEVVPEPEAAPEPEMPSITETVPVLKPEPPKGPVKAISEYTYDEIKLILDTHEDYICGSEEDVRQRIHQLSELVGIGFSEELTFAFRDNDGNRFELKNSELTFDHLVAVLTSKVARFLGLKSFSSENRYDSLYMDHEIDDLNFEDLLEWIEDNLGVASGKLKYLPFEPFMTVGNLIDLVALLLLPAEEGFSNLFRYIDQPETPAAHKSEKWYETSPVMGVDQLSEYEINYLFDTFIKFPTMDIKEIRQRLYSASEVAGIGFHEELTFYFQDENGKYFQLKNTELDLETMMLFLEEYFVGILELDAYTRQTENMALGRDFHLSKSDFKDLLFGIELELGVKPGKLQPLPFYENRCLGDYIALISILVLPLEKGFAPVFQHIEALESDPNYKEEPEETEESDDSVRSFPHHLIDKACNMPDENYDYQKEEDAFDAFNARIRDAYDQRVQGTHLSKHIAAMNRSVRAYFGRDVDVSVLPAHVTNRIRREIVNPEEVRFWQNICAYSYDRDRDSTTITPYTLVPELIRRTGHEFAERYLYGKVNPNSHLDIKLQEEIATAVCGAVGFIGDLHAPVAEVMDALAEQCYEWRTGEAHKDSFDLDTMILNMSRFNPDETTCTGVRFTLKEDITDQNYHKFLDELRLCNLKGYVLVLDMTHPVIDETTAFYAGIFKALGLPCIAIVVTGKRRFKADYPTVDISRNYYRLFAENKLSPTYGRMLDVHMITLAEPGPGNDRGTDLVYLARSIHDEVWWKYRHEWWHTSSKLPF